MIANDSKINKWIIKKSIRHANQDDLILALTEKTGMSWPQAEAYVFQVQTENSKRIARGQSPILILIALTTMLGGLGLIGYETAYLVKAFWLIEQTAVSPFDVLNLASFFAEYAGVFLKLTPLGLAMIFGGWIGMQDVWEIFLIGDKD